MLCHEYSIGKHAQNIKKGEDLTELEEYHIISVQWHTFANGRPIQWVLLGSQIKRVIMYIAVTSF